MAGHAEMHDQPFITCINEQILAMALDRMKTMVSERTPQSPPGGSNKTESLATCTRSIR